MSAVATGRAEGVPPAGSAALDEGRMFVVFRVALGVYVAAYALITLPHAPEVFSRDGLLASPDMNDNWGYFPGWLLRLDSAAFTYALFAVRAVAGALVALGLLRRAAALVAWLTIVWCVNRNNFSMTPELPYVGWALAATAVAPGGETWARGRAFRFPPLLRLAAWIVLGASYTYTGISKLGTEAWVKGTALRGFLLSAGVEREGLGSVVRALPAGVFTALTFAFLGLELSGIVWVLIRRARPVYWALMMVMHVGILVWMRLAEVSLGMMCFHLLLVEPTWLPKRLRATAPAAEPETARSERAAPAEPAGAAPDQS